jgi:hypothetical protein
MGLTASGGVTPVIPDITEIRDCVRWKLMLSSVQKLVWEISHLSASYLGILMNDEFPGATSPDGVLRTDDDWEGRDYHRVKSSLELGGAVERSHSTWQFVSLAGWFALISRAEPCASPM